MAYIWILVLASIAGASASNSDRIVGGSPTTIEEYPSLVQLQYWFPYSSFWTQVCAANILTTRLVLSAAHCFDGMFYTREHARVLAGQTYRDGDGMLSLIKQEFLHPEYNSTTFYSDICVAQLQTPLIYSLTVQQATIVAPGAFIPDNTPVVHAGWGSIDWDEPPSDVLLDVNVYTINHEICRDRYAQLPEPEVVTTNMICAGILDVGGRDACSGDSGGPMYFQNIIVGVIAWGHGCAHSVYPGVSTAVSPFTEWIISIANQIRV